MTSAAPRKPISNVVGIALMLIGIFIFAINNALGKWLLVKYSVGKLMLVRSIAALIMLIPLIRRESIPDFSKGSLPALQILRAFLSAFEVAMFFWAISYLPLADAATVYLASPIFVTALSVILLGEIVGWRQWTAVLMGFTGVVLALRPSAASFSMPALIALTGSGCFAFLMIITRRLGTIPNTVLVVGQIAGMLLFGAVTAPFAWIKLTARLCFYGALRRVINVGAILCQRFAKAGACECRRAVSIHKHRLGNHVGLYGV
jgi:drug/metabolite transporter (DMT)-like permease